MISSLYAIRRKLAGDGSVLSAKISKNILLSLLMKGGTIVLGLLLIPLTISFVDTTRYGVWITISSVVNWLSFFDIGLGNGMRNRVAESLAKNEVINARKYVSTAYVLVGGIALLLFLCLLSLNSVVEWSTFLNVPDIGADELKAVMLIAFGTFCIQFVVQLLNTLLTAVHEPAKAGVIGFIGQVAVIITMIVIKGIMPGSLLALVLILTCIPISVLIIASIVQFSTRLRFIAPSLKYFEWKFARSILQIGGSLFFIQIGTLVLFQTDSFIIIRVIDPAAVTQFNVAYKMYSVLIMVFSIMITPYWSGFTEAYAKNDFAWMQSTLKRIRKAWVVVGLCSAPILFLCSPFIFKIWIGDKVYIPMSLSLTLAGYAIIYTGVSVSSYFLNGIGKVKMQQYLYLVGCVVNIPLGIFLTKWLGVVGSPLANCIILLIICLVLWKQSNLAINNAAKGIWNR